MLSTIRKNHYPLTCAIVFLTIVSFIWLYNRTNLSQVGTNDVASIYGRVVQQAEIDSKVRENQLALAMGMTDFVRDLGGMAENEEVALTNFILNSLVLEHQAPLLSITPTDAEVAASIQLLPMFQVEGTFDSKKYASFLKEQLIPRGFTERHLEGIILNELRLKKLKEVITSPISISENQVREAAHRYQPVTAKVIRFDRNAYLKDAKDTTVTPSEEKAFYEKNKTAFVSEETRAVSYVIIELPVAQQKLEGKERVHAMQQLSESVSALKQKSDEAVAQGKSFEKVVSQNGYNVVTTAEFNHEGKKIGETEIEKTSAEKSANVKSANVKSANAKSANAKSANVKSAKVKTAEVESGKMSHDKLPPQAVILTAFKLGKVGEVSDIVQIGQAFYITSLVHLTPSRPLTFEEAQLRIETLLRTEKADKVMNAAATKTYQAIHQAMAAGKTFEDALKASGATAELLANVIPADNSKGKISPQQQEAINTTLSLKEGELSELKRDRGGEFIVYLQHRAPLSDADWKAHQPEIQEAFLGQQRDLLFFDWLRQSRADAHVEMLNRSKTRRRR